MDSLSLKNLTNALIEVDGWQALGVQLDINYHKLKEFGSLPTIEERKLAMLQFWLDTDLQASWEKLLCGLKKMGLNRIAQVIQREYQVQPSHQANIPPVPPFHQADIPPVPPSHQAVPPSHQAVPPSHQAVPPIQQAVPPSHQADIPPVPPYHQADIPPVPPFHQADIPPVPPFHQADTPPVPPIQSEHVASAAPSSSPPQTSVERKREVQGEIDTLKGMYDHLFMKTVKSFKQKTVETPTFLSELRTSIAILPSSLKDEHKQFLKEHSSEIAKATSVDELFITVNCYSDFLNCSLVVHVIDRFGDDQLREDLQDYIVQLEAFRCRTNLTDFVAAHAGNQEIPPDFIRVVLKMGPQWELHTLNDLEEFRKTLRGRSFLTSYAFRFTGVETGSIFLTWSVPRTCSDFLVSSLDLHFRQQYQIEGVTIDGVDLAIEEYGIDEQDPDAVTPKHVNEFSEGLLWASGEGCLEDVVFLLSTEVEVNSRDQWGSTGLMLASGGGHLDVVRELLKAQADVNAQDEERMTALMLASVGGHLDVVRELLKAQADVNAQDEYGWTALMEACLYGHTDTVHALVSGGAQVDLQDVDGQTALIRAAQNGHTETVSVLLEAGADVNLQEKFVQAEQLQYSM